MPTMDHTLLAFPPRMRQALVDAGYRRAHDLVNVSTFDLAQDLGVEPADAQRVADAARREAIGACVGPAVGCQTALEMLEQPRWHIPTGVTRLDAALGGGISAGQVTELCGPPGAGKTQLCMLLSIAAVAADPSCEVLYVDTEGSFVPERVEEIAARWTPPSPSPSLSADHVLSHIRYARLHSQAEQLGFFSNLPSYLDSHPSIGLVVVDSIAFHLRQESHGDGPSALSAIDASTKQHLLANVFQMLTKIAVGARIGEGKRGMGGMGGKGVEGGMQMQQAGGQGRGGVAVVVTNHVTVRLRGEGARLVPALGDLWGHVPADRLFLFTEFKSKQTQPPSSDVFRGLLVVSPEPRRGEEGRGEERRGRHCDAHNPLDRSIRRSTGLTPFHMR